MKNNYSVKFHHIAYVVGNIDKSIEFYTMFGFKKVRFWRSTDEKNSIVHLLNSQSILIELFSFHDVSCQEEKSINIQKRLKRGGINHMAFEVENINECKERMISDGLIDDCTPINEGRTGILYLFIKDPDGNLIEIVQDDRKTFQEKD